MNKNKVVCVKCDKFFSKRSSMLLHVEKFHPNFVSDTDFTEVVQINEAGLKEVSSHQSRKSKSKQRFSCKDCRKEFATKQKLTEHRSKQHPRDTLVCSTCKENVRSKKGMVQHIKKRHPAQVISAGKRSFFLCPHCGKDLSSRWAVSHHIKKFHPDRDLLADKNKSFICATCERHYKSKMCVKRHIKRFHPELVYCVVSKKSIACPDCGTEFTKKWNLNKHREKFHAIVQKKVSCSAKKLICPLCKEAYAKKPAIREHFSSIHDEDMETYFLTFYDQSSFSEWRNQLEKETKCSFSISCSYSHNYRKTVFYTCSRSGFYNCKSKGERRIRCVGSKKINAYCPAEIELRIEENCFKVTYLPTHIGHENKICYMKLTEDERNLIVQKLSEGVPPSKILLEMKVPSFSCETTRQRIHLLSIMDIRNIGSSAGVYNRERFRDFDGDGATTETWLELYKDSVLYYKQPDQVDDQFSCFEEDDFALLLMTDMQRNMLQSHGNNVIALDSTFGVSKYNYILSTVMVLDNLGREYPCCFFFSNKVTDGVLQMFFSLIKEQVPDLRPQTVMTDMEDLFYNAWVKVMSEPKFRLFSAWHVLRAWKEDLDKLYIKDIPTVEVKSLKTEIYTFLKFHLLEEKDETTFYHELRNFLDENRVMNNFQTHFQKTYVPCIASWAYCHRKYAGISTDLATEAFHKLLRHHRLKGKRVCRLEDGLAAVISYLERREAEKISIEEKGFESYQIKIIRNRHIASLDGNVLSVDAQDEGWIVPSFRSRDDVCELYFVRLINESCTDCKLVCTGCSACAHMYSCTCMDSSADGNMCKHIHLVCQYQKSAMKVSEEPCTDGEPGASALVDGRFVDVITENMKSTKDVT